MASDGIEALGAGFSADRATWLPVVTDMDEQPTMDSPVAKHMMKRVQAAVEDCNALKRMALTPHNDYALQVSWGLLQSTVARRLDFDARMAHPHLFRQASQLLEDHMRETAERIAG